MAKVKGPLFSMAASGKQGALVYSRNPYGPYTRAAPGAAGSASSEQQEWRDAMEAVMVTWETNAGITVVRRNQWYDFARTWTERDRWGREIRLDAARWFMKFGIHRQRAGLGLHLGPPISPGCDYYPALELVQTAGGIYLDADPEPTGDQLICVSRVDGQSVLRNFCPRETHYVGHGGSGSAWPYEVWDNGDLVAGTHRYFVVVRVVDGSGRPSSKQVLYLDAEPTRPPEDRNPDADTWIYSLAPTSNYCTDPNVVAGKSSTYLVHGLLYWDLTDIDPGTELSSATLYLWCNTNNVAGNISAHRILVDWVDTEATYNLRSTGVGWSVAGGAAGVDYGTEPEDTTYVDGAGAWFEWDVTDAIQTLIDTPNAVRGLWMRFYSAIAVSTFDSIETATPAHKPYLHLIFS